MGAYKEYNDKIISESDNLFYWFECKVCHDKWFNSFCICPKCGKVRKFKILSTEKAIEAMMDRDSLYKMSVYGLLLDMEK
jgi:formate dehydrogenase maturation protein FdhE